MMKEVVAVEQQIMRESDGGVLEEAKILDIKKVS
jgi:hypothetical protein